jgi:uncharacterized protein (TIGR02678 family)
MDEHPGTATEPRRRRYWAPGADAEVAAVLRQLAVRPWLVAGRDDAAIAAVRRNSSAVREALSRLGWILVVERGLVRLRKSPPPRRHAWAAGAPAPVTCSWYFLLVAAAESMPPRVGLSQLVAAARVAAAEAGLPVTGVISERRAIVAALRMLHERGVVEELDGDVDTFVHDEEAPVLLAVHHTRLVHVIANFADADPVADPEGWLAVVEREPDPARRMRRRLIDDSVVHGVDLDEAEAEWLSRRLREDGAPLAGAFGLHVERRTEGVAFVVPDEAFRHARELGPLPFPAPGTTGHAALLLCEAAATSGGRAGERPGWRSLPETDVIDRLATWGARIAAGRGGWAMEDVADPAGLAAKVMSLLFGLDLVRVDATVGPRTWWFSPATARWWSGTPGASAAVADRMPTRRGPAQAALSFDLEPEVE